MTRPKIFRQRPSAQELKDMILVTSLSAAAKHFCGNSSAINVIRQWCEEYNIEIIETKPRRKRWIIPRPTRDEVEIALQSFETWPEIAAYLNLSVSHVKKLAKYFKLRK